MSDPIDTDGTGGTPIAKPSLLDPTVIGLPPPPLAPNVKLIEPDGTPTREFHTFLTQLQSWLTKLRNELTGGG